MNNNSSEKKSAQLGMPYGTATNRLRKQILFSLLIKLGDNICFQCGKLIESVDVLSIEHKKAWLDKDPALFWDLDNIAFSHLFCNISAAQKIPVMPGNKRCTGCKTEHPIAAFGRNKHEPDGLQDKCKEYKNNYKKLRR